MMDPQQKLFTKVKLAVEAIIGKAKHSDGDSCLRKAHLSVRKHLRCISSR